MAVLDMKAPGYGMVLEVQSPRTLPALHERTAEELRARIGVTLCGRAVTSSRRATFRLAGQPFVWLDRLSFSCFSLGFGQARMPRRV